MKINGEFTYYKTVGAKQMDNGEQMIMQLTENGKLLFTHKFNEGTHCRAYFYEIEGDKIYIFENLISAPCNVFKYTGKEIISSLNGVDMYFKKK